ncbi:MAG: cytidylate kinase-like family protein [Oscillospiraceae bacterium]|nr:cytidylate kinase-like family protein [Oscillospiraceae bacterium]
MSNIITVSREFGSGGRELGKRLAGELGYAYYDREIVTALAKETGMDEGFLDQQLEASTVQIRFPIHFAQSFSELTTVPDTTVHILSLQSKLIKELASKGDCVFVGRAADALLEEKKPFKLFVYADQASKLARCRSRATDEENFTDKEMIRQMKRIDKARAEYHDIISSRAWGERTAYHLCVNTTGTEIKAVIPALADYYRAWLNVQG